MLQTVYQNLNETVFDIDKQPDTVIYIDDIKHTMIKKVWL